MMPNYENENCEACTFYARHEFQHKCLQGNGSKLKCNDFHPSLECRKVRALEEIAAKLRVTGDGGFLRCDAERERNE
jgi:hypothetical protein